MLFFRSEEQLDAWCLAKNLPKRPVVRMTQLWDGASITLAV